MITSVCKKSTQALNYFARKKGGKINKMKAIKLVFFADRYHLRKYGRPVVGDIYWAMKLGPVGSNLLNTTKLSTESLDLDCLNYAKSFLSNSGDSDKLLDLLSKKELDLNVFSQTDIEALEVAYNEFGDKDQFELADITHNYPEWLKHKKDLEKGKKRVRMNYLDFFSNPKISESHIFDISKDNLDLARDIYQENIEAEFALA